MEKDQVQQRLKHKKNVAECFQCREPTKHEVLAFKALSKGEAESYQQMLALKFLVDVASRSHDLLYIPNEPDQTAFVNGRAFVGNLILRMVNVPIGKLNLKKEKAEEETK